GCAGHVESDSNEMIGDRRFSHDHGNPERDCRESDSPGDQPGTTHRPLLSIETLRAPGFLAQTGFRQLAVLRGLRTECQAVRYANAAEKSRASNYRAEALVPRRQADWHACSLQQHHAR